MGVWRGREDREKPLFLEGGALRQGRSGASWSRSRAAPCRGGRPPLSSWGSHPPSVLGMLLSLSPGGKVAPQKHRVPAAAGMAGMPFVPGALGV